jgi:hypothetical protein
MFSIEFEPLSLGEIGRIKNPIPPMGIIITAGTDENHIVEAPNPNNQIPNKFQSPKFQTFSPHPLSLPTGERGLFRNWNLRFVWDLGFVICNLKSRKPFSQVALVKNSEKPLMVIVPVARASLRPLTLIIFAANFLPNIGIGHVDKTEEKTTQMGEVSDAASCPCHGRIKFEEAIDDH